MFELEELKRIREAVCDMRIHLSEITKELTALTMTMRTLAEALSKDPEDARLP